MKVPEQNKIVYNRQVRTTKACVVKLQVQKVTLLSD